MSAAAPAARPDAAAASAPACETCWAMTQFYRRPAQAPPCRWCARGAADDPTTPRPRRDHRDRRRRGGGTHGAAFPLPPRDKKGRYLP